MKSTPKVYEKRKYDKKWIQGIRAAIYYRTFGQKNIDNKKVAELENYANKFNFTIHTFFDHENNVFSKNNYELETLLKIITEGKIEVLIVDSLVNLSGNIKVLERILQMIEEKNIHLICLRSLF